MKVTDQQVEEAWRSMGDTPSYVEGAKILGIHRNNFKLRILTLRVRGADLKEALGRGKYKREGKHGKTNTRASS